MNDATQHPFEPVGTVLDLDISRVDERQRRLRLRLPTDAGCWDYAPLIDLVRREPGFASAQFVGQTVAERLTLLRHLPNDESVERFARWYEARMPSVLPLLAHRPRNPENHYTVDQPLPPFVASSVALLRSSQRRASAAQWRASIDALTGSGVKREELDLSGVLTRLEQKEPTRMLSRSQVVRLVHLWHATPRLVCESRFGYSPRAGWHECCERLSAGQLRRRGISGASSGLAHVRYRHRSLGWQVVRVRMRDLAPGDWWLALDDRHRRIERMGFSFSDDAIAFADMRIGEHFSRWGKHQRTPLWEHFSLPGGDEYSEFLVQLDDWPASYWSSHYRTRNVLVHIRASLRHTVDGSRLLFLDEVQSDWHAALHAQSRDAQVRGGSADVPEAPFKKEWPLLAMKIMLWWAQRCGVRGLAWSSLQMQQMRWRGHGPPELLYSRLLPEAAAGLARALNLSMAVAGLRIRDGSRRVTRGSNGWQVVDRGGRSTTKPFQTRAQAEAFADQTGQFVTVDVPVLWMEGLPPIKAIPLLGAGTMEAWTEAPRMYRDEDAAEARARLRRSLARINTDNGGGS